ncbi:hypothetical protein IQ06DRAFT_210716 [Phaeosphaeriaceae sp. SRC1lsM3a]|nr:hypothetical protein IQ06DRAFT_210716 [Stagonospora sp. SRC1lsM3a]
MPIELVLITIGFVPADHILPFRSVCRLIKEHIDTSVFKSYLQRMVIAGYEEGPPPWTRDDGISRETLDALPSVKFSYSHLADTAQCPSVPDGCAVFNVDPQWFAMFDPGAVASMEWFIQMDHIALELDTGVTSINRQHTHLYNWSPGYFNYDRHAMTITVDWRLSLRNMLIMEAEIARKMCVHEANSGRNVDNKFETLEHPNESRFTYGPIEDYVRLARREHEWRYVYMGLGTRYDIRHPLYRLMGLFGQPRCHVSELLDHEDGAVRIIMALRQGEKLGGLAFALNAHV